MCSHWLLFGLDIFLKTKRVDGDFIVEATGRCEEMSKMRGKKVKIESKLVLLVSNCEYEMLSYPQATIEPEGAYAQAITQVVGMPMACS